MVNQLKITSRSKLIPKIKTSQWNLIRFRFAQKNTWWSIVSQHFSDGCIEGLAKESMVKC